MSIPESPHSQFFESVRSSIDPIGFFRAHIEKLNLSEAGKDLIDRAYIKSDNAHRNMKRANGKPYFIDHVVPVTNILLANGVKDSDMIAAALLHDVVEDTPAFSDTKDFDNETSRRMSEERMAEEFNPRVARLVMAVTKVKLEWKQIINKEQREVVSKENLCLAEPDALLIKMADRFHSVMTLDPLSEEKRRRTIGETLWFYIPLFEKKVTPVYPEIANDMIQGMHEAMTPYLARMSSGELF